MTKDVRAVFHFSFGGDKSKDRNGGLYERMDPAKLYERQEMVGKGTYGCVYKGRNRETNQPVALKVIKTDDLELRDILNELQILNTVDHPNVATFYAAYMKAKKLTMVLELCEGGSVIDVREGLNIPFKERTLKYLIRETTKAVHYLHSLDLIHRDIKGGNVLLTGSGGVKITDFGVSAQLAGRQRTNTFIGTPYWMAPEVIACDEDPTAMYGTSVDVWSIGITVIELADGVPPLVNMHPMKALQCILQRSSPAISISPTQWSAECHAFVKSCLIRQVAKRPDTGQLLQHPWLTNIAPESQLREDVIDILYAHKCQQLGKKVDPVEFLRKRARVTMRENLQSHIAELDGDVPSASPFSGRGQAVSQPNWAKSGGDTDMSAASCLQSALATPTIALLKRALSLAKTGGCLEEDIQKAQNLLSQCSALDKEANEALRRLDRNSMDSVLCAADKLGMQSKTLQEIRHLLHGLPVEKLLQKQLVLATQEGDVARVAQVTLQLKDQFYSMFGEDMFRLTNYGFLRKPRDFAKGSQFLKKEENVKGMLSWTRSSIPTSLLKLEPKLVKLAVGNFKRMQQFMGDRSSSCPLEQGQEVVDLALLTPGLRDETYCQLIKQLNKNPHTHSQRKGWQLMQVCVQIFPPSDDFSNYLEIFLRKSAVPTPNFDKDDFVCALNKTMFDDMTNRPLSSVHDILNGPKKVLARLECIRDVPLKSLPTPK